MPLVMSLYWLLAAKAHDFQGKISANAPTHRFPSAKSITKPFCFRSTMSVAFLVGYHRSAIPKAGRLDPEPKCSF
jgi:hypothetical protein